VGAAPGSRSGPAAADRPVLRTFERGALIYGQGDAAGALYRLENGEVKLYALTPAGQAVSITYVRPGETFGEEALLGAPTRPLDAEAVGRSQGPPIGRDRLAARADRPERPRAAAPT